MQGLTLRKALRNDYDRFYQYCAEWGYGWVSVWKSDSGWSSMSEARRWEVTRTYWRRFFWYTFAIIATLLNIYLSATDNPDYIRIMRYLGLFKKWPWEP
jgi:hypothetical protein